MNFGRLEVTPKGALSEEQVHRALTLVRLADLPAAADATLAALVDLAGGDWVYLPFECGGLFAYSRQGVVLAKLSWVPWEQGAATLGDTGVIA